MPVGVVRSREDEIALERAKDAARRQYPDVHGARFYNIVMAIYKKMTHYDATQRLRGELAKKAPVFALPSPGALAVGRLLELVVTISWYGTEFVRSQSRSAVHVRTNDGATCRSKPGGDIGSEAIVG